ncbi:MAG: SymE family type I addiction module toxin [Gammaproteobacteria bacterium]
MNPQNTPATKARCLTMGDHRPKPRASDRNGISKPVPNLRLCGRWLQDAGFGIGQRIKVEVNAGRLTIEPAE